MFLLFLLLVVFFVSLIKQYIDDPINFSIQYVRTNKTRSIEPAIEKNIIKELTMDKQLIADKDITTSSYNYSYIKDRLKNKYNQTRKYY